MSTKINWTIGAEFSVLYAAERFAKRQRLGDPRLAEVIGDSVTRISERLSMSEVDEQKFWRELLAASAESPSDATRTMTAFLNAGGAELTADTTVAAITRALADARLAMNELYPRLGDQLPLRGRPLQAQWDMYGPGLLASIVKRSHPDSIPKSATIVLVHPASGGGSGVVPDRRWGWIEAVLTNVIPGIPEVVRIGWMLATMGMGHSQANRFVPAARLPRLAAAASLPIVLHAAADLDLISQPDELIETAMAAWEIDASNLVMLRWWDQQRDGSIPFAVGIKALDRMLESA